MIGATRENFPDCWKRDQFEYFTKAYPFLAIKYKKLGCKTCKEASSLGAGRKEKLRYTFATEWQNCLVSPYDNSKQKQMKALRKKINEHSVSQSHKIAETIPKKQNEKALESSFLITQTEILASTQRVFRTAYHIAKTNRPYTDHPKLIDLQVLNGVDMGRVLYSNVSCADIVYFISQEMRQALLASIKQTQRKLTVIVDESTSLSKRACLIVYLRTSVGDSEPLTFFLDLLELDSTTADGITSELLRCLEKYGLDDSFQRDCLVGFCSDGAAVVVGKKNGVYSKLKDKFPV